MTSPCTVSVIRMNRSTKSAANARKPGRPGSTRAVCGDLAGVTRQHIASRTSTQGGKRPRIAGSPGSSSGARLRVTFLADAQFRPAGWLLFVVFGGDVVFGNFFSGHFALIGVAGVLYPADDLGFVVLSFFG